jgi:hypothetical protein
MTSDHVSAPATYVMWCEAHVWNVGVLQRAHFSIIIIIITVLWQILNCTRNGKHEATFYMSFWFPF